MAEEGKIILIDKPKGITSFDVIRILRKKLGIRKMGHAGTLDPFATGLLIIAIGDATKKLTQFIKLPKTYEAEIVFGIATDSGDETGKIIRQEKSVISREDLEAEINKLIGVQKLAVPIFSAIKIGGEALYKKARRGEKIDLPIKEMEVRNAILKDVVYENSQTVVNLILDVSSGTYIRSLAVELGRRLSAPAHVRNLRRTKIGDFSIEQAEKI